MNYYCDLCDKTTKIKTKSNLPKSLTHTEFEKRIQVNHTNKSLDCFDSDKKN